MEDKDAHALKLMPGAVIHFFSHHCLLQISNLSTQCSLCVKLPLTEKQVEGSDVLTV